MSFGFKRYIFLISVFSLLILNPCFNFCSCCGGEVHSQMKCCHSASRSIPFLKLPSCNCRDNFEFVCFSRDINLNFKTTFRHFKEKGNKIIFPLVLHRNSEFNSGSLPSRNSIFDFKLLDSHPLLFLLNKSLLC